MQVILNGTLEQVADGITVKQLLEQLCIGQERVAVEVNESIVPKASYENRGLEDGDRIEIVHFVGGG